MKKERTIYQLKFRSGKEHYFTSLAAIYELFSSEEVGCKVEHLWNLQISENRPYVGKKCSIYKVALYTKRKLNYRRKAGKKEV